MKEEADPHLEHLNKLYETSSTQFDKQLLYISSGALGISFAFLKDIVQLPNAHQKFLLCISWFLLLLVIIISLVSQYSSLKALDKARENINQEIDGESASLNEITKGLNVSMMVLLGFGLFFLFLFIAINL